jgi:DNA polymerase elongation subunit (family B)
MFTFLMFLLSTSPLPPTPPLSPLTQPYSMRVSIDLDLRVGSWYIVRTLQGTECCTVHWQKDMLELCEPKILAFDIECEKAGTY